MLRRYPLSKLLNVMFTRSLSSHLSPTASSQLIVNSVNPGLCYSELAREVPFPFTLLMWMFSKAFAHTAEEGSRQYVYAALVDEKEEKEVRGGFIWGFEVAEVSDYLLNDEGEAAQARLWVSPVQMRFKPEAD